MRWQLGGNLQSVKLICELDWTKCFFAFVHYVWSEVVTDVVDCLSNETFIWRTLIIFATSVLLVYTVHCKIQYSNESVINKEELLRIGCKVQDLELKVNVLTYKVQYGTWPLPHHINKKYVQNDQQDVRLTLSSSSDANSWIKHLLFSPRKHKSISYEIDHSDSLSSNSKCLNVETKYVSSQYESQDTPCFSSEDKIPKTTSEKSLSKKKKCRRCSKEVISKAGYVSKSENFGLRRRKFKPPFTNSETQYTPKISRTLPFDVTAVADKNLLSIKHNVKRQEFITDLEISPAKNMPQCNSINKGEQKLDKQIVEHYSYSAPQVESLKSILDAIDKITFDEEISNKGISHTAQLHPVTLFTDSTTKKTELHSDPTSDDSKLVQRLHVRKKGLHRVKKQLETLCCVLHSYNLQESPFESKYETSEAHVKESKGNNLNKSSPSSISIQSHSNFLVQQTFGNEAGDANRKILTSTICNNSTKEVNKKSSNSSIISSHEMRTSVNKSDIQNSNLITNEEQIEEEQIQVNANYIRVDTKEDLTTVSEISSISEFPKESDSDEHYTATLLQEALKFKQALLSQLEIENKLSQREKSKSITGTKTAINAPRYVLNNHFQSKLLDIITEERSTCSSTEMTSKTYLLLKMSEGNNAKSPNSSEPQYRHIEESDNETAAPKKSTDEELDAEFLPKSCESIGNLVRASFESIRDYSEIFSRHQNEAIAETRKAILQDQDYLQQMHDNENEEKIHDNENEQTDLPIIKESGLFPSSSEKIISTNSLKTSNFSSESVNSETAESHQRETNPTTDFKSLDDVTSNTTSIVEKSNEKLIDSETLTSETDEICSPNSDKTVIDVNSNTIEAPTHSNFENKSSNNSAEMIVDEEEDSIVPLKRSICSLDVRFPESPTECFNLSTEDLPNIDSIVLIDDEKDLVSECEPEISIEIRNEESSKSDTCSINMIESSCIDIDLQSSENTILLSDHTSTSYRDAISFESTSTSDKSLSDKSIPSFSEIGIGCTPSTAISVDTNETLESEITVSFEKSKQPENSPSTSQDDLKSISAQSLDSSKTCLTHRRSRSYICPRKSASSPRNGKMTENEPKRRSLSSSSSCPVKTNSKSFIPVLRTRQDTRKADCESRPKSPTQSPLTMTSGPRSAEMTEVSENKDRIFINTGECQNRTLICINLMTAEDKLQTKLVDPKKFLDCVRTRELKIQNEEGGDVPPLLNDDVNSLDIQSAKIIGVISSGNETEGLIIPSIVKVTSTSIPDNVDPSISKKSGDFQLFQVPEELTKEEYASLLQTLHQDADLEKLKTMRELCMKLSHGLRK